MYKTLKFSKIMLKKRYIHNEITADLKEKMVFIGGPRQVGKTTLAKIIGKDDFFDFSYLNWDSVEDRRAILKGQFRSGSALVIFDEIHKYKRWKNFIKGEYDKYKDHFNILVTGSARLDLYKKGGDSLMGRYRYYRLHPFSLAEILEKKNKIIPGQEPTFQKISADLNSIFKRLFLYGGFPEPLFASDEDVLRRFHNERLERLIKEDIRDIETLRDLSSLEILASLLPGKVGSLLSLNSLREDIEVSYKTIALWVDVLERFYYHYRIYPFSANTIKSLRKEPKMYLWDWSAVENEGARLENMIASHLLKFAHYLYDSQGYKTELYFIRDREQREVDFLITLDRKPWFAVEVKTVDKKISTPLKYFTKKLSIPFSYQIIKEPDVDFLQNNIRVISADKFLSGLV